MTQSHPSFSNIGRNNFLPLHCSFLFSSAPVCTQSFVIIVKFCVTLTFSKNICNYVVHMHTLLVYNLYLRGSLFSLERINTFWYWKCCWWNPAAKFFLQNISRNNISGIFAGNFFRTRTYYKLFSFQKFFALRFAFNLLNIAVLYTNQHIDFKSTVTVW